jgi:hypothetical protein
VTLTNVYAENEPVLASSLGFSKTGPLTKRGIALAAQSNEPSSYSAENQIPLTASALAIGFVLDEDWQARGSIG